MEVHDRMQMEQQADTRRNQVLNTLPGCCIHPTSRVLIRPLSVTPFSITPSQPVEYQAIQLSALANNGAQPLSYRWLVWQTGSVGMTEIGTTPSVTYTPSSAGTWTVQLIPASRISKGARASSPAAGWSCSLMSWRGASTCISSRPRG
jgi:hypothetical protein